LESFTGQFRSECKLIWYLPTMYINCDYFAISKNPKWMSNCLKSANIILNGVLYHIQTYNCYCFLSLTLHESGPRKALLGPWLNNTEVYLTPFICTQNSTVAG
jgi:hypothetical protein